MGDAVVLDGVSKAFGAVQALKGMQLRVPAGSIYGFLGPNGAGKTTTLRLIMGILRPDTGQIAVLDCADPAQIKSRLGYLPEEKGLYRKMRVAELAVYFARLKGMEAAAARRQVDELLERFELQACARQRCETLSKGMGQKLQLLVTVVHDPDLIILDEPFSGLDPVNRNLMCDLVLELRAAGKSVIFSTHDMHQAERLCDAVVLIDRGEKVLDGPIATVRRQGGRVVDIDFDGEAAALQDLPGVARLEVAGQRAEAVLDEGVDAQAVLAALVGRVALRRFEVRAVSLHDIFVKTVKRGVHAA